MLKKIAASVPAFLTPHSPLSLHDNIHTLTHEVAVQGGETELGTAALQRWDDLADVVSDETESGISCVFFHDCTGTQKRSKTPRGR